MLHCNNLNQDNSLDNPDNLGNLDKLVDILPSRYNKVNNKCHLAVKFSNLQLYNSLDNLVNLSSLHRLVVPWASPCKANLCQANLCQDSLCRASLCQDSPCRASLCLLVQSCIRLGSKYLDNYNNLDKHLQEHFLFMVSVQC